MLQFVIPEEQEKVKENFKKSITGKNLGANEYTLIRKNGTHYPALVKTIPIFLENKVAGIRGLVIDITERKEAEEKLRESEEKYRDIFENARDVIYVHDLKGKISSINKIIEEYGYARDQIIGKNMLKFIPKKYWPRLIAQLAQLARGIQVEGEIEINTPIGKRSAEYRSNPIKRGNKVIGVHSILRDTTERKRAKEALCESQQKFKALFSANPDAAVFLDTDLHVVEANSRFTRLFGYSLDEIKGKIITDVIVPDDSREESRILRQKVISGPVEIVTARIRKDGSQIPLFMSGGPVFVNEKLIGSVMVYRDISDIITVQEELTKALNKAELLNEKLHVVGSLSRHDVRNKLSAVTGYAYLLKKRHSDQADIIDGLGKIEQSVSDSVKIFDFAKIYEQLGIEELTYINVEKVLEEAMALFSGSLSLEVVNDCHGLTLLADSLLRQLFYDLIDNSLKHGEKVTKIRVHYEKVNQDKLIVVYDDDGVGISAENKPRLFKEGFSTSGTSGYGLFLIRKMMEVYGWTIEENGEPGKGAKFVITIPRASQSGKESFQIT